MTITEQNRARKVSLAEVMVLRLAKLAADGDTKALFGLVKLLDWFPVNTDDLHYAEMKANAERTRHKLMAMIEQREAREAEEKKQREDREAKEEKKP